MIYLKGGRKLGYGKISFVPCVRHNSPLRSLPSVVAPDYFIFL